MSVQMTEAMKSAKQIQAEMVQWENRLEHLKQEYANLQRQNEVLSEQISQKRVNHDNFIATERNQFKKELDNFQESKKSFDQQRSEFSALLIQHDKERDSLKNEQTMLELEKSRVAALKVQINDFIQAVRRAYNVLPD